MKIRDAFPRAFERAYPAIEPETPMLSVLPLLRFHEIDALPLSFESKGKPKGISGYSCLARVRSMGPHQFASFLKMPCEQASKPLVTIRADQSLSVLLNTFLREHFGFARIEESRGVGALLTLSDVLGLYETDVIDTKLSLADVSSPAFSMPNESSLKEGLEEMFKRGYRRIFVDGTHEFVWDRGIIEHIFSPAVLTEVVGASAKDIRSMPMSEVGHTAAEAVDPSMKLDEAAHKLNAERGQCLVFDGKVVTPWDVVMKPWKSRALKIRT